MKKILQWLKEFFDPLGRARRIDKEVLFKAMVNESYCATLQWSQKGSREDAVATMWRWHTHSGVAWKDHHDEAEEFLRDQGYA